MPKAFLQGASLTPTFIQHFKCGVGSSKTLKNAFKNTPCKNAFKKHPLQNRTNVQIKGGGVKGLLNIVQKNCTFLKGGHPLPLIGKPHNKKHLVYLDIASLCVCWGEGDSENQKFLVPNFFFFLFCRTPSPSRTKYFPSLFFSFSISFLAENIHIFCGPLPFLGMVYSCPLSAPLHLLLVLGVPVA